MSDLVDRVQQLKLGHVQLALGSLMNMEAAQRESELAILRDSGLTVLSGMIGFTGEDYSTIARIRETGGFLPDDQWPDRKQRTEQAGKLCQAMGVKQLTTHIGFVPPSNHEQYPVMTQRLREVAALLEACGVELLLETGQEGASELLQFLNDLGCRNVAVNFDPANMILYGAGDPIEAVRTLGRHIHQVHIKDATLSDQPAVTWGREVPFGTGQVGAKAFLAALRETGYTGALVIEREAGGDRLGDVTIAIESIRAAMA